MDVSRFFIDRPRFAAVLSIIVFLVGLIALFKLPISEYPEVSPPQVVVRAQFPGANPRVIAETVSTPLEEQINGVDNLLYYDSQATSDGSMTLTCTFRIGTDPIVAESEVQNRINRALPRLPEVVRQIGVTTEKSSPTLTMVVHMVSPDNRYDALYLRNYAQLYVRDPLLRIPGMGSVLVFGEGDYAMRIWLDPSKLAARGVVTGEVVAFGKHLDKDPDAARHKGGPLDWQPILYCCFSRFLRTDQRRAADIVEIVKLLLAALRQIGQSPDGLKPNIFFHQLRRFLF